MNLGGLELSEDVARSDDDDGVACLSGLVLAEKKIRSGGASGSAAGAVAGDSTGLNGVIGWERAAGFADFAPDDARRVRRFELMSGLVGGL